MVRRRFARPLPPGWWVLCVALAAVLVQVPALAQGVQRHDQRVTGARSPRNANYRIDARLDHAGRRITGSETIQWRNISAHSTSELRLHLFWNAWRDASSSWMRERQTAGMVTRLGAPGSITIRSMRLRTASQTRDVTSQIRFISPDDGNPDDRTLIAVDTPEAIAPGGQIEIDITWDAQVPRHRTFGRTGFIDNYYLTAHWFPKVAVLEDSGWRAHQFHSASEFYSDYGVYDVRLTLPAGFVVGATGRETERRTAANGDVTYRFQADDVHDFAWTASPRFVEHRRRFAEAGLPPVTMRLLLQPEHAGQEQRFLRAAATTLQLFGTWFGPYPYDHLTIVDPAFQSSSAAMEYPTLLTSLSRWLVPPDITQPEALTIHETGHMFFQGIVGNNETEHAWLDEGIVVYATAKVIQDAYEPNYLTQRYFGGHIPWVFRDIPVRRDTDNNRLPAFRDNPRSDTLNTPTFRLSPASANLLSYNKTALALATLERHLGWPVMQRALAAYFQQWQFRHPTPQALFDALRTASGQDLGWFTTQVFDTTATFDYGVQQVTATPADGGYRIDAAITRNADGRFPVDVVVELESGERMRERWDGNDARRVFTWHAASRARAVHVDPDRALLLDLNYTNNSWVARPQADAAAAKWGMRWMTWLQDLMLTYAFFL